MKINKDLQSLGTLMLVLFVIGVITGVSFIGFGYLKETACEQAETGYDWYQESCYTTKYHNATYGETLYNASTPVAATVTAVTKISIVEAVLDIVLGLLALVTVVAIFVVVISSAKSMTGNKGY